MVCKSVLALCAVLVDIEQHLDYLHSTFQPTANEVFVSMDQCMDVQATTNTKTQIPQTAQEEELQNEAWELVMRNCRAHLQMTQHLFQCCLSLLHSRWRLASCLLAIPTNIKTKL